MNRKRRRKERQAAYWIGWAVSCAIRDESRADRRIAQYLVSMADAIRPVLDEPQRAATPQPKHTP